MGRDLGNPAPSGAEPRHYLELVEPAVEKAAGANARGVAELAAQVTAEAIRRGVTAPPRSSQSISQARS